MSEAICGFSHVRISLRSCGLRLLRLLIHPTSCMINPVKHGLVSRVQDWPYSSFRRDVRRGVFPLDWAGDASVEGEFGEA